MMVALRVETQYDRVAKLEITLQSLSGKSRFSMIASQNRTSGSSFFLLNVEIKYDRVAKLKSRVHYVYMNIYMYIIR